MSREPRESDLPEAPVEPMSPSVLAAALETLAAIPEPVAPPPAVVPREITIGQQIAVLREALSRGGRVLLQTILARCTSRTEAAVTFLATLELVRRRQVRAEQSDLFGPIVIEALPEPVQP
jgi:segregation and condensation protein A